VYSRPHIYKDKGVVLSRSATLERHVVVGAGAEIGENTIISHSSIGRNCKIGNYDLCITLFLFVANQQRLFSVA
jgi:UDP-3-O-[3-hydroxymyristoyl] glucosamine N-acyltransferase